MAVVSFTKTSDADIVGPRSATWNSDAQIVGPISITFTSDAFILGPAMLFTPSDALIVSAFENTLSITSNAVIVGPSSGAAPVVDPSAPLTQEEIQFLRECAEQISCPGSDYPVSNYSSESPDLPVFLGLNFGWGQPIRRLGTSWSKFICGATYTSHISQEDANLGAARLAALLCPEPNPPTDGPTPTQTWYFNPETFADVKCPDGSNFRMGVRAGMFVASSLSQVLLMASSYALRLANENKVCLTDLSEPPYCCLGKHYTASIRASGKQLGANPFGTVYWEVIGDLPDGMEFNGGSFFGTKIATLEGTPTKAGLFNFRIRVSSQLGAGFYMDKAFAFCVADFEPANLPDAGLGGNYDNQVKLTTCAGQTGIFISAGSLPDGLSMDITGRITGTVSMTAVTSHFTVRAETQLGVICEKDYTIHLGGTSQGQITPGIFSAVPTFFGGGAAFPAGNYRVDYVNGAVIYGLGAQYRLNWTDRGPPGAIGYKVKYNGGVVEQFFPGTDGPYATQALCEAANAGKSITFAHTGGTIGMFLQDDPYFDNSDGSPDPTFELFQL